MPAIDDNSYDVLGPSSTICINTAEIDPNLWRRSLSHFADSVLQRLRRAAANHAIRVINHPLSQPLTFSADAFQGRLHNAMMKQGIAYRFVCSPVQHRGSDPFGCFEIEIIHVRRSTI